MASVTAVPVMTVTAHVMPSMHIVTSVHVCIGLLVVMRQIVVAAVVTLLGLGDKVMFLIALALIRWAVTLAPGVVIAHTHWLRA